MTPRVARDDAHLPGRVWFGAVVVAFVARLMCATTSLADDTISLTSSKELAAVSSVTQAKVSQWCVDCHSGDEPQARLNLELMLSDPVALHHSDWRKVLRVVRDGSMPPEDAEDIPNELRQELARELQDVVTHAALQHASDPGPTRMRRLTSAEFDYCVTDLTGLQLELGESFVSDGVGGSGFTNSASAQFLQDATLQGYLDAARTIADHAVIGAGPIRFFEASGSTGMELSAIQRIQEINQRHGFRVSAGEGAKPYGLDQFPRALEVAWRFRHRGSLGTESEVTSQSVSLQELAVAADLDPKFVQHLWASLHRPDARFPLSEIIAAWNGLPDPSRVDNAQSTITKECQDLIAQVQYWQERFAGAASAEEEAAVLTGEPVVIPSDRDFLVRARRKRIKLDDNFTPDLNDPRLYSPDGTVGLRISVEMASPPSEQAPAVIIRNPTFQFRFLEQVTPDPVALSSVVTAESLAALYLGQNPGGEAITDHDLVVHVGESKLIQIVLPEHCNLGELQFNARLDQQLGHDSVVRVVIEEVTESRSSNSLIGNYSSLLRDQSSQSMQQWELGLTEFAQAFPQISHREPAPSDRDPIPPPFDNTYNLPERNYFHTAVKYHRADDFLTRYLLPEAVKQSLDEAWSDLLSAFDYHDVKLRFTASKFGLELPAEQIEKLEWNWIDSLPEQPRQYISAYKREHESIRQRIQVAESQHLSDLCRIAERAWRRPLSSDELQSLRSYYAQCRQHEQFSHDQAVRSTLVRILVSPEFLFRIERSPTGEQDQPISANELASRLSFSLWSSIPDDELLALASDDRLLDENVLVDQVTRMLQSDKSRRLSTEFFGQWLGFYQFDRFRGVDQQRFPEFDEGLRSALYQEAIALCEHLIRQDRPYTELIDAPYVILNRRVAEHYGLAWPDDSNDVRLISLEPDQPRGGVLGLGAVLVSTSAPLRTSPVKRGDWVLRRLLATPVPPPPADAGSIPADEALGDGKTVRERLDLHRNQVACQGCHVRIDPLGFALERFDSLGRWRETYREGQQIDDVGMLSNGEQIQGIAGLRRYLRVHDTEFRRTLAANLVAYFLGRPESIADTSLIESVCDELAAAPQFSTAVKTIVLSPQFRRIRGSSSSLASSESTSVDQDRDNSSEASPTQAK